MKNLFKKALLIISSLMLSQKPSQASEHSGKIMVAGVAVSAAALYALYHYAFTPLTPEKENGVQELVAQALKIEESSQKTEPLLIPQAIRAMQYQMKFLQNIIANPKNLGPLGQINKHEQELLAINRYLERRITEPDNTILQLNTPALFVSIDELLHYKPGTSFSDPRNLHANIKNSALRIENVYAELLLK